MHRFSTLERRFVTIYIPIMLMAYATVVGLYEWYSHHHAVTQLERYAKAVAASQSIILAEPIHNQNYDQVSVIIASIISNSDLSFIAVLDKNETVIDTYGKKDFIFEKRSTITYVSDSTVDVIGYLHIGVTDRRVLAESWNRIIYATVLGFVLLLVAVVSAHIALSKTVGRPLDRLLNAIRATQGGTQREAVHWPVKDEMGELVTAYNSMQDGMHGYEEQLKQLLLNLEARVEERTQELIEARTVAESANIAKSNFLSTMSHEIRTPLNGVLGLAQLLAGTDLDQDQKKKVSTILSSGRTLLAIISDVLDMSRIEAGGIELEEKAFNLGDLLSVIASTFQSLVDDKGLHLAVKNEVPTGILVKGDQVRLRQVLWNLLSNAINFTEAGTVSLSIAKIDDVIEGISNPKDHILHFCVSDTGAGIAPDRVGIIFDAFTQEDSSTTRKHGGTGLGLSIVKQLTRLMGGTIEAKSEVGKGTQFDVYIPFLEANADEIDALAMQNIRDRTHRTEPLSVLIAEDNEVNAEIARAFLEQAGHKTIWVENGLQAVEAAREGWGDLILMDIHMPEMNGVDATKIIRAFETGGDLPIIGLTAEAFVERHAQFIDAGMDDVLTKPFTEQHLLNILAMHRPDKIKSDNPSSSDPISNAEHAIGIEGRKDITRKNLSSIPEDSVIGDETRLAAFRKRVGADIVVSLLDKAQISLDTRMEKLREGIAASDHDMMHEAIHSIKGSSGSMFAMRLSELAADIEQHSADVDVVRKLMPKFEEAAKETATWWRDQKSSKVD